MTAEELHTPLIIEVRNESKPGVASRMSLTWETLPVSAGLRSSFASSGVVSLADILDAMCVTEVFIHRMEVVAADGYNVVLSSLPKSKLSSSTLKLGGGCPQADFPCVTKFNAPVNGGMYSVKSPTRIALSVGYHPDKLPRLRFYSINTNRLAHILTVDGHGSRSFYLDSLYSALDATAVDCTVLAEDGVQRTFQPLYARGRIAFTHEKNNTWNMSGEQLPRGLRIKSIFFLRVGDACIVLSSPTNKHSSIWHEVFLSSCLTHCPAQDVLQFTYDPQYVAPRSYPVGSVNLEVLYNEIASTLDGSAGVNFAELSSIHEF